ncbi:MAG: Fe-S cluster assembly protein NifU [Spirochaetes bacterium]|nr:Fe-S cluster assembly protein NifU [Spirochaetota bacterium]
MWDYSKKVKDHFTNPRNVGEIESPEAEALIGNITCGDALKLTLRIDRAKDIITDAKFKTFGCASAIASSSMLTEMVKGKTVDEALAITNQDIAREMDGLPEEKMHCSVMGKEALDKALGTYRGRDMSKAHEEHGDDEGYIVCKCFGVTNKKIERVVRENNLTTVEQVTNYTKAGGMCGACKPQIEDIIEDVRKTMGKEASKAPGKPLTAVQKMKRIEETLETEIRPELEKDGGGVELIDIEGNRVLISLRGMCSGCNVSNVTIKSFIEPKLREFVSPDLVVEEAKQ